MVRELFSRWRLGVVRVTCEIDSGSLDARNRYRPAWCIEALSGNGLHLLPRDERNPDGPALNGPLILLDDHLKFLGSMVGRTVVLRGSQESRVVSGFSPLHQSGQKLIRRETSQLFVFGRHNHVEPARGASHQAAFRQTIQGQFRGIRGHTQRFAHLLGCEVVAATGRQVGDVVAGFRHCYESARIRYHRMILYDSAFRCLRFHLPSPASRNNG
jgi:hypothetical protein